MCCHQSHAKIIQPKCHLDKGDKKLTCINDENRDAILTFGSFFDAVNQPLWLMIVRHIHSYPKFRVHNMANFN